MGNFPEQSDDVLVKHYQNRYNELKNEHNELQTQAQSMADALEKIEKWCEESGLKNVAIDDVKGMAIYHSLHLSKQARQQFKDGKGKEVEKRQCSDCGLWFKSEGRCPECNPMG